MALVFKDRVKVTSTTSGTGTLTLGSAVSGFQDFSVIGNGNTTYYTITDQSGNWEVGIGTYTSSGTTLSRDTILESSNGGTAIDFPSGTKTVFVTYPAEKSVYLDASGNATLTGVFTPSGGISNGATFNKTGSGGEGGELHLEKGATSTLSGDVVIDAYNQSIRIFENGGTNRGAQLDVSSQSAGVGSTLLTSSTSAASFPTLNQNTTGTAAGLSATLAIASGGTGQTTKAAAFNALSPITSTGDLILGNGSNSATRLAIGANNTVLTSNGSTASWAAAGASLDGQTNSTSPYETSLGYQAGNSNTASGNTFIGYQSGLNNVGADSNSVLGFQSLYSNTDGSANVAIGYQSMYSLTSGSGNNSVGKETLFNCTDGYSNNALGYQALYSLTSGSHNTAIGNNAGRTITSGSYNTCVGTGSKPSSASGTNQVVLGNTQGQGDDYVTIGSGGGKIYNSFTVNATWTQTSDGTMKNVIGEDSLGLSFINRLKPITFTWKPQNELPKTNPYYAEENKKDVTTVIHGFVAQDVKAALDAEGCNTFNGWVNGSDGIQAISREMFVSPLVKAVQELSNEIQILKAELATIKGG